MTVLYCKMGLILEKIYFLEFQIIIQNMIFQTILILKVILVSWNILILSFTSTQKTLNQQFNTWKVSQEHKSKSLKLIKFSKVLPWFWSWKGKLTIGTDIVCTTSCKVSRFILLYQYEAGLMITFFTVLKEIRCHFQFTIDLAREHKYLLLDLELCLETWNKEYVWYWENPDQRKKSF